jgi:hypothetical protein
MRITRTDIAGIAAHVQPLVRLGAWSCMSAMAFDVNTRGPKAQLGTGLIREARI